MPFWTEELHPSLQFIVTGVCPTLPWGERQGTPWTGGQSPTMTTKLPRLKFNMQISKSWYWGNEVNCHRTVHVLLEWSCKLWKRLYRHLHYAVLLWLTNLQENRVTLELHCFQSSQNVSTPPAVIYSHYLYYQTQRKTFPHGLIGRMVSHTLTSQKGGLLEWSDAFSDAASLQAWELFPFRGSESL